MLVEQDWRQHAGCAGLFDAMYPEPGDRGGVKAAKKVCNRCPVKDDCLDWADSHDVRDGIWGGLTARERGRPKRPKLSAVARKCALCPTVFEAKRAAQRACHDCVSRNQIFAPRWLVAMADDLVAMKRKGMSDAEMARVLRCSPTSIRLARQELARQGIDLPKAGDPKPAAETKQLAAVSA